MLKGRENNFYNEGSEWKERNEIDYKKLIKQAEKEMKKALKEKREKGVLSEAHNETHSKNVATYGSLFSEILARHFNYKDDEIEKFKNLSTIAGFFHDIAREAKAKDHSAGAIEYIKKLRQENSLWKAIPESDFELILKAIALHEKPIQEVFKERRLEKEKVSPVEYAIWIADKVPEASGFRVLERRSFFVGKERILKGDLKDIFKYPEENYLAVLGETMLRLYSINNILDYPPYLRCCLENFHTVQYEFYKGLLEKAKMSEEEAAEFFYQKKFPRFSRELVEKIKKEKHLSSPIKTFGKNSLISKKINELNKLKAEELEDLKESSFWLVKIFSQENLSKPENLDINKEINQSQLNYLKKFLKGIKEYNQGETRKIIKEKFKF